MSYLLDGTTVRFTDLIKAAQDEGYEGDGGIYTTSGAARLLRSNGHTVKPDVAEPSPPRKALDTA